MTHDKIVWQDYYEIACPVCRNEMMAAPSYYQLRGRYDLGHGTCPECQSAMQIIYNPADDSMRTVSHAAVVHSNQTIH